MCHQHISQYLKIQGILELGGSIIHYLFRATHPLRGKQRAYPVANILSGSVATELR